jgi:hypothetical protein
VTTPHFLKPATDFDEALVEQNGTGQQASNLGAMASCYTKDLSSILSDQTTGSVFFWIYHEPPMSADVTIVSTSGLRFLVQNDTLGSSPDDYEMVGQDAAGSPQIIMDGPPSGVGTPQGVWVAIFMSWDTSVVNGGEMWLQQKGMAASDIKDDESDLGNNAIEYTDTWFAFCQDLTPTKPLLNARLSQFWFKTTKLDFSMASVREDFVTSAGQPIDLGIFGDSQGNTPDVWWPAGDPAFDGFTLVSGPGVSVVENGPAA